MGINGGVVNSKDDGKASNPLGYTARIDVSHYGDNGCTGTFIDKRVLLTAVHCNVIAGNEVTSYAGNKTTKYKVEQVITHQDYKQNHDKSEFISNSANDFALVLLDRETNARPLSLADRAPLPGDVVSVSGFGLNSKEMLDGKLRTARNKVERVSPTSGQSGGAAVVVRRVDGISCSGDSGGPLVVNGRLAGVLSGGQGDGSGTCKGKAKGWSSYASVTHQRSWIEKAMNDLLKAKKDEPQLKPTLASEKQSWKDCVKPGDKNWPADWPTNTDPTQPELTVQPARCFPKDEDTVGFKWIVRQSALEWDGYWPGWDWTSQGKKLICNKGTMKPYTGYSEAFYKPVAGIYTVTERGDCGGTRIFRTYILFQDGSKYGPWGWQAGTKLAGWIINPPSYSVEKVRR